MNQPKVSVVMTVYNGKKYIREAIDSILAQTFTAFEFIIVDDASTDETWTILNSVNDPRLRLVRNNRNIGIYKSANNGLSLSKGEYIARMDADDVSLPERLARQVDFLETHPEIGVLGTGVHLIDGSGCTSHTLQLPTQHGLLRWYLCFYNPIAHSTVMMRRKIIEQVGGYSPYMVLAGDYDLWCRLSYVTRLSNLQDVLVSYRIHDANVTTIKASEQRHNSVRISCQMISQILSKEVPIITVQSLWEKKFETASDAQVVAGLVYRLYQAFSNGWLSPIEKQAIRRDAAMRMCGLTRPWVKNVNVWGVLARAFCMYPSLVMRVAKRLFRYHSQ